MGGIIGYKEFMLNTPRLVPSTAAGLITLELVRRKCGDAREPIAIEYKNSTILLSQAEGFGWGCLHMIDACGVYLLYSCLMGARFPAIDL